MSNIPTLSPGCFGSALAYQDESSICKACVFRDRCQPVHADNLAKLRAHFGIRAAKTKPERKAAENTARPAMALELPKKVQELVDKLDRSNLRVTEKLALGENPFSGQMVFLQIACHLLLRLNRPVTRQMLSTAYMSKLGWQAGTADAHARMAIQALTHIGAANDVDGAVTLRKAA